MSKKENIIIQVTPKVHMKGLCEFCEATNLTKRRGKIQDLYLFQHRYYNLLCGECYKWLNEIKIINSLKTEAEKEKINRELDKLIKEGERLLKFLPKNNNITN